MSGIMGLARRVADLELELEQLRAQVAAQTDASANPSEDLTPTYLTQDPATGQIGADFSGKVQASELDLVADPATPSPIKWITEAGAQVAVLTSDASGNLTLAGNSLAFSSALQAASFAGAVQATELDLVASPTAPSPIKWKTALGGQVALLESDASGNLSLEAESLTLTTDGSTPATFSGEIAAQGIQLPLGTNSTPPPTSIIEWLDSNTPAKASVQVLGWGGGVPTLQILTKKDTGVGDTASQILITCGAFTVPLFNDSGQSAFLFNGRSQPQAAFCDFGGVTVSIAAGSVSGSTNVNFHASAGFTGSVGPFIVATPQGNNNLACRIQNVTNTGFTLTLFWTDGATTHGAASPTVAWWAFGV